jgi:hypothetical protein
MEQILVRILGYTYSLIALPAMAVIAIAYYRKFRTKGGIYFSIGAVAMAAGSMFNQLFPKHLFFDQSAGAIPFFIKTMGSIALIVHLVGFFIMVIAWGIITYNNGEKIV